MSDRRTTCRSCGSAELHLFLELGDLPLSDGLLREEDLGSEEPRYPLDVAFCAKCSLVQILKTVPPEELFCRDYPYYSSFSDALLLHSRGNVESLVTSRGLGPESLVVELASNDGYLLQYYVERGIPVLGIDPAEGPVWEAQRRGVPSRHAFFTAELARELRSEGVRADVVHANNVLAHVADTNGFVEGIRTLLADDGVAVIEVPYVRELIEHCEFDTIYHEHLCYFSVTSLEALFRRNHLSLNRVEPLPIHGGSLRLFVGRRSLPDGSVWRFLREEEARGLHRIEYYRDFSQRVEALCRRLRSCLLDLRARGKRIAAYGAAAKGVILLNAAGIGAETLEWVADRNVHKQGRVLPGVRLPIVAPERLVEDAPDYVLILPWNLKDEIVEQQIGYRERGGRFIVPVPEVAIV
jgi:SAM-dependent methyltransferase